MKRSTLLTFAALAIVAACSDATLRSPTEPGPVAAPSLSTAGADDLAIDQEPTVCIAWEQELVELQVTLQQNPDDAITQDAVATYEARIAAMCQ